MSAATAPANTGLANLPPGRTPLPKGDEWAKVGEVTVKGSSSLGCETKMVGEWLRVLCRGKNDTGGRPTTLKVLRATPAEVFSSANEGVTSLVLPFIEGVHVEAAFSWTNKSHKLVVDWPRGAPKPTVLGNFEGAASPLDGGPDAREAAFHRRACACEKETHGTTTCEMQWIYVEDCFRTYENDCANLLICTTGHPDAPPTCPPGKRVGGYNRCVDS